MIRDGLRYGVLGFVLLNLACTPEPAGRALPRDNLTEADRTAWVDFLESGEACEFEGLKSPMIEFHTVDATRFVVQVLCSRGLYQGDQVFFLVEEREGATAATLLRFPQLAYVEPRSTISDEVSGRGNAGRNRFIRYDDTLVSGSILLDQGNGTLVNLNRFRGIGGCGTRTTYDLTTPSPRIVDFRARVECTTDMVPPEEWHAYSPQEIEGWPRGRNPDRP